MGYLYSEHDTHATINVHLGRTFMVQYGTNFFNVGVSGVINFGKEMAPKGHLK